MIAELRGLAARFAREQGAGEELVAGVALAVSEAVTNAVKYAYDRDEPGTVEVALSSAEGWLAVRVADRGHGFGGASSGGLGLGLSIIASLCAEMKIIQDRRGTEIWMRFSLRGEQGARIDGGPI